jgi:hypothetical protein
MPRGRLRDPRSPTPCLSPHRLGARQGKARQGKARQGKARQGKARQGKARQGKAGRFVDRDRDRVHANVSKDLPGLPLDLLQARKVRETGIAKRGRITLAALHNQDGNGSRSRCRTSGLSC